MGRRTAMVLGVVLAAACGGPFADLPQVDQDRWQRCFGSVQGARCGGASADGMYQIFCMRQIGDQYAQEPAGERAAFLAGQGCPPSVAGYTPRAFRASGGEARPAPAAAPAEAEPDVEIARTTDPTQGATLVLTARLPRARVTITGTPETAPDRVALAATWGASSGMPDACGELGLAGAVEWTGATGAQFQAQGVVRRASGTVPLAELRRVAAEEGAGVRLCGATARFSATQAAALRTYLQRWDVLVGARPAP
jgi:hypothetical protein